ncbi:hypothetical protein [Aeromonas salmonicida]|uniref:hypothetical protein n=1 Tax=Aeromonas salmonicida TaxID=645 RepID=UPI0021168A17|nr:hypothetical protein [Aeromonas salmonicida]UUI61671.1 hypothetical protein NP805_03445 [Aeromonas salmonicida]
MTPETLLLRQVHPSFIQNGRITSQVFRPTPKDEQLLSVDNNDSVTPHESWRRFTANLVCKSIGVLAVSYSQCVEQELPVIEDGTPYPEHCSIKFSDFEKRDIEKKAKLLRAKAEERGWLFSADVA